MTDRITTSELLSTTDAQVWAKEWVRIAREIADAAEPGRQVIDEGWMIGWFANAIETGRNAGIKGVAYDSTADTLKHSRRVGELLVSVLDALAHRAVNHDLSKTKPPELAIFNEFTPKLRHSTYGSEEYKGYLADMKEGLEHHYAANRHHPEHYIDGISGMTLIDLIEMLADWKAATERHEDGDIQRSLEFNKERFGIDEQLQSVLVNTVVLLGWFH